MEAPAVSTVFEHWNEKSKRLLESFGVKLEKSKYCAVKQII